MRQRAAYILGNCSDPRAMPITARRRQVLRLLSALPVLEAWPAGAALLPPNDASIQRIRAYLNGITTLEARFQQINPDGGMATGRLYSSVRARCVSTTIRPRKVLLIATDWRLIFWDGSIEQQNVIPIAETPLGFLLGESVGAGRRLRDHRRRRDRWRDRPQRDPPGRARPGHRQAHLRRAAGELRRWVVTDAQGLITEVLLHDVVTGRPLDPELFRWRDPKIFGPPKS